VAWWFTTFNVEFVAAIVESTSVVPNLFYAVAHLSLSAERRGSPLQNNRIIHSVLLGTNMSKQNMCFTITHHILFNFSISNKSRPREELQCDFCSCVTFSTRLWILDCVMERAHLRSSSGVKLNRLWYFPFTCERYRIQIHINMCWGREVTIGELLSKHLDNRQTPSAKNHKFY